MATETTTETRAERTLGHVALTYRRVPGMCATEEEQRAVAADLEIGAEAIKLLRETDELEARSAYATDAEVEAFLVRLRDLLTRAQG